VKIPNKFYVGPDYLPACYGPYKSVEEAKQYIEARRVYMKEKVSDLKIYKVTTKEVKE
jgi:hypothetical protein